MGRKIPGKKHRGVKDPFLQHAQREESLKLKINAPPLKPDDQEIPKSLEHVMLLKQMTKEGKFNKKKKRNRSKNKLIDAAKLMGREMKLPGMTKPDKVLPKLVQRLGEHDHQFISRVGRATEELINEIKFEDKYRVNVKRNTVSGDVEKIEKRVPDEVDAMFEKKKAEMMKPKSKKKLKANETTKLSKSAKFRLKKAVKKQKVQQEKANDNEFGRFVDHVAFGEVVHQPPQLTARPKKAVITDMDNKPGRKNNLLLSSMLSQQKNVTGKKDLTGKGKELSMRDQQKNVTRKKDLTGKRKELSMRDRHMLETERSNVVAAYRKLKSSRV